MTKFIEVHRILRDQVGDQMALPILINLAHVESVKDTGKTCTITLNDGFSSGVIKPIETYSQVRRLIGACCGGIPIAEMDDKIAGID